MSRAVDLFLILLIAAVAWFLLGQRSREEVPTSSDLVDPIECTVRALGDVSLEGLGLIVRTTDGQNRELGEGAEPRQVTRWSTARTTRVVVPWEGDYRLFWGVQTSGFPADPVVDVGAEARAALLAASAGTAPTGTTMWGQPVTITRATGEVEVRLTPELANELRRLRDESTDSVPIGSR